MKIGYQLVVAFLVLVQLGAWAEERSCEDYYYGLNGDVDFKKAYACAEKKEDLILQMIMLLNGEGVSKDPAKAQKIFLAYKKTGAYVQSELEELYAQATNRIKNSNKNWPKIDFCKDLAGTTIDMNRCSAIQNHLDEKERNLKFRKVKKGLSKNAKRIFDKMVGAFKDFKVKDGERMYLQYVDGTIRGIAGMGQESYLEDRFESLVLKVVEKKTLQKSDADKFKENDQQLNLAYGKMKASYQNQYTSELADASMKEYWKGYKRKTKELLDQALISQRAWIKYRDSWSMLTTELYGKSFGKLIAKRAIESLLSKQRSEELLYDPVGP